MNSTDSRDNAASRCEFLIRPLFYFSENFGEAGRVAAQPATEVALRVASQGVHAPEWGNPEWVLHAWPQSVACGSGFSS